jgi:hypothetical protein
MKPLLLALACVSVLTCFGVLHSAESEEQSLSSERIEELRSVLSRLENDEEPLTRSKSGFVVWKVAVGCFQPIFRFKLTDIDWRKATVKKNETKPDWNAIILPCRRGPCVRWESGQYLWWLDFERSEMCKTTKRVEESDKFALGIPGTVSRDELLTVLRGPDR